MGPKCQRKKKDKVAKIKRADCCLAGGEDRAGSAKGNEGEAENEQAWAHVWFCRWSSSHTTKLPGKKKSLVITIIVFKETAYPGTAFSFSLSLLSPACELVSSPVLLLLWL